MKHLHTSRLNAFLVLALVLTLAYAHQTTAFASEVTGTLSSSGSHTSTSGDGQDDTDTGTGEHEDEDSRNDNAISGSVVSNGGGGGSSASGTQGTSAGAANNGAVLGASTYSYSGAPEPGPHGVVTRASASEPATASPYFTDDLAASDMAPLLPAAAVLGSGDSGAGLWFSMLFFSLLLIGAAVYFYNRPVREAERI